MGTQGYGPEWVVVDYRLREGEKLPVSADEWFVEGAAHNAPTDTKRATRRRRVTRRKGRDPYEQIVHKHAREDRRVNDEARDVDAVIQSINPGGDTDLAPPEFHILAKYLFSELPKELRRVKRLGVIKLANGNMVLCRRQQAVAA